MLSREDNELMCRVGAGTAMGTALRRYWLPALQVRRHISVDELCAPVAEYEGE